MESDQAGYAITDEAKNMLNTFIGKKSHPGNGRFAVNLFDELIQLQALRLLDYSFISTEQLSNITEEDVKSLQVERKSKKS